MNSPCLWIQELNCAVTMCNTEGVVIYQNTRSVEVNGDVCGGSLIPYHNERSREIIADLLRTGGTNTYTIEKHGVCKLIYQTVWREGGEVCGLVEFSIEMPTDMPHHVRG